MNHKLRPAPWHLLCLLTGWLISAGQVWGAPVNIERISLSCPSPINITNSLLSNKTVHEENDRVFSMALSDWVQGMLKGYKQRSDDRAFKQETRKSLQAHLLTKVTIAPKSIGAPQIGCHYRHLRSHITLHTTGKPSWSSTVLKITPDASSQWQTLQNTNIRYCMVERMKLHRSTLESSCSMTIVLKRPHSEF